MKKKTKIDKIDEQSQLPVTPREKRVIKQAERIIDKKKLKLSHRFIYALSLVSILGFVGIVSETLFNQDLRLYVESLLMFIIGFGLILESRAKSLISIREIGLTSTNFTHLITTLIGFIAIAAGIFSFPTIMIEFPGFVAIRGIISIIAIVIIIIQTWVIE